MVGMGAHLPNSRKLYMDTKNDILSAADIERIVSHMNEDHADSILAYVHHYGALPLATDAKLLNLSETAMQIEAQIDGVSRHVVIPFSSPLLSAQHAHVAMVQMSKEAKRSLAVN